MPKVVDHDARRLDFIQAAFKTIVEEGMEGTTVRAVAKNAGYSTGALVHYFRDKDELIVHSLRHAGGRIKQYLDKYHDELEGRVALESIIFGTLPTNHNRRASWRLWIGLWGRPTVHPGVQQEQQSLYDALRGKLSQVLQESVELQELPATTNLDIEVSALVALLDGIGVQSLGVENTLGPDQQKAIVTSYVERLYK